MTRYVTFKLNHEFGQARPPYKKYKGDAGWDLFICEDVDIPAYGTVDIHTGVHINMPPYMYGRITGRSSTLRKHELLINEAIIDNGYTGELFICVRNMTNKPFHATSGMRLAQIIFHKIEDVRWVEVPPSEFVEKDRGNRGFGSTGVAEVSHE